MPAYGTGRVRPPPEHYHVGWISALPIEYTIARELLDEEYDPPDLSNRRTSYYDNPRIYSCGRIGEHYVVIACLPKGVLGNVAATSLAKDLLHDFPNINISLMVGIGGGAPKKHDIRLGDVVVSTPSGTCGGVIQYEYGKQKQQFEQTGFLDKPPMFLLSAVAHLSARHEGRDGHKINSTIARVVANNYNLQKRYQKPLPELDVLYQPDCWHSDPSTSCLESCPSEKVVQRPIRETHEQTPVIHYGLIASANKVMRNAIIRDQLAESWDVLCFDMEAAGLMDDFRCIVIRGISDYSDSHKNDVWQGYAAATAASYATELLGVIPSIRRSDPLPRSGAVNDEVGSSRRALSVGDDLTDVSSVDLSSLDPPWLNGQSRQSTFVEPGRIPSRQVTFHSTPDLSMSSISYRIEDVSNRFWIKCQCPKKCGLEWDFTNDIANYRETTTSATPDSCLLKKYLDNTARSPIKRMLHDPSTGIRGKPLWTDMKQNWQRLHAAQYYSS